MDEVELGNFVIPKSITTSLLQVAVSMNQDPKIQSELFEYLQTRSCSLTFPAIISIGFVPVPGHCGIMTHDAVGAAKVLPRKRWVGLVVLSEHLVEHFRPLNEFRRFRNLIEDCK